MKSPILLYCLFITGWLQAQLFDESLQSGGSAKNNTLSGISMNGHARASFFSSAETNELSHTFAEMALQFRTNTGPALLRADLRLRSGVSNGNEYLHIEPKELYAGFNSNLFDFLAGYQIVRWGKTDGFNPTDNLSPKNYFFLSDDPDDQLMSNFMIRSRIRPISNFELEMVWIPFYKPSVYHYDWFNLGPNVLFTEAIHPERILKNGSLASKMNFNLGFADGSVSWFRGFDSFHGFGVQQIDWSGGFPLISNAAQSYLKTSLGADFAVPFRGNIFRLEMARNITENPNNEMHIPMSDWHYVAAVERNISGFTFIAQ